MISLGRICLTIFELHVLGYALSFPTFGTFSVITSSNKFAVLFSPSSPSGTPIMQILFHFMLSRKSNRQSSLFSFSFLYSLIGAVLKATDSFSAWLCLYWRSLLHFSFHFLYSSALGFVFGSFFYDFYLFLELLVLFQWYFPKFIELSVFSCISLSLLQIIILNYFSDNWQISISFGPATGKLLCSFGGIMFSCFFFFSGFWWLFIDAWAFKGTVTSSSNFGLALMGKDFHMEVSVRVPDEWDSVSLVPRKAQRYSLCAVSSAKVDISEAMGIFCG